MIIVLLSDSYPPSVGGKQREVELIARELARLGHRVHVITKMIEGARGREEGRNLTVHRFTYREGLPVLTKLLYVSSVLRAIGSVLAEEGRINVIHANDLLGICLPGVLIGLLLGIPVIAQGHGTDILLMRHGRPRWKYLLYRWVISRASRIVVNARYAISYLADVGVPEDKIAVVPCPIPTGLVERARGAAGKRRRWAKIRVATVANLVWQKGLSYLILAAKKVCEHVKNVEFIVVGDGPLREELMRQVRGLGLEGRVRFLGRLPYEEALGVMASSDIFVLPSVYDQLPMVILEAMALGKPVVATRVCGIPDVIEDGRTGLLVEPRDPEGLAAAILKLVEDPGLREELSQRARLAAEHYDVRRIVRLHIKNYQEAIRA